MSNHLDIKQFVAKSRSKETKSKKCMKGN